MVLLSRRSFTGTGPLIRKDCSSSKKESAHYAGRASMPTRRPERGINCTLCISLGSSTPDDHYVQTASTGDPAPSPAGRALEVTPRWLANACRVKRTGDWHHRFLGGRRPLSLVSLAWTARALPPRRVAAREYLDTGGDGCLQRWLRERRSARPGSALSGC